LDGDGWVALWLAQTGVSVLPLRHPPIGLRSRQGALLGGNVSVSGYRVRQDYTHRPENLFILSFHQMNMTIRATVCVFLLFAPLLHAQENSVDRRASDFGSSGIGLTETLLKFAHQQNVRIAVEYVDRNALDQPIAVNLQDKTVRQGLDSILRNGRGYSWRTRNGVIEIRNQHVSKRANQQLDTVIPVFQISDSASAKAASAMLWMNLQAKLDPSMKGFAVSVGGGAEASNVIPATLHNRTVREILAYIVVNSRAEGWIVTGPSECLGFTPYCGLWMLVETPPSIPSYGPLLDNIRKNL
jgi:hypothetical protein